MKTFEDYDKENPSICNEFKRFTLEAIASGKKNYSSKSIIERIRWETEITAQKDQFKINNNYTSDYSRKFMQQFPKHKGFFRTRVVKKTA